MMFVSYGGLAGIMVSNRDCVKATKCSICITTTVVHSNFGNSIALAKARLLIMISATHRDTKHKLNSLTWILKLAKIYL